MSWMEFTPAEDDAVCFKYFSNIIQRARSLSISFYLSLLCLFKCESISIHRYVSYMYISYDAVHNVCVGAGFQVLAVGSIDNCCSLSYCRRLLYLWDLLCAWYFLSNKQREKNKWTLNECFYVVILFTHIQSRCIFYWCVVHRLGSHQNEPCILKKELAVSKREQKFDFYYCENHEHHHIVCMEIKENCFYLSIIISR